MVDVSYQRRMAAQILKCGLDRVWIDPDQLDEVAEAVTRGDVRRLIAYRVIQVRQKKGVSRGRTLKMREQKRKGHRKGPGSRRGPKFARTPRKRTWIRTIRPLRQELRTLRADGKLDAHTYRKYYRQARGNMFKSRSHLLTQLEAAGVLSEVDVREKETARDRARREREERRAKAQAARSRVREKAAKARAMRKAEEAAMEKTTEAEPVEEAIPEEPAEDAIPEEPAEDAGALKEAEGAEETEGAEKADSDEIQGAPEETSSDETETDTEEKEA